MMSVLLFKTFALNLLRIIHDRHCSIWVQKKNQGLDETSYTCSSEVK